MTPHTFKRRLLVAALLALLVMIVPGTALAARPAQVKGLKFTKVTASSVTLAWSRASRAASYYVYRRVRGTSTWSKIGRTSASVRYLRSSSLSRTKNYEFRVRAKSSTSYGSYSSPLVDFARRPAPVTINDEIDDLPYFNGTLNARWNRSLGAVSYRVTVQLVPSPFMQPTPDGTSTPVQRSTTTTGTDFWGLTTSNDMRDLLLSITPISACGIEGRAYSTTLGASFSTDNEVGFIVPSQAGDPTSTVRCRFVDQVGVRELVAYVDDHTELRVDGASVTTSDFWSAWQTTPSAPVLIGTQSVHWADDPNAHAYVSAADIYPSGRVVPSFFFLYEPPMLFTLEPANRLIRFLSPDSHMRYWAQVDAESELHIDGVLVTPDVFFTWMAAHPDTPILVQGPRLSSAVTVNGHTVDYHVDSVTNTPPGVDLD